MPFRFSGSVFFSEVDSLGVVYYANYLKFLDNARTSLFNHLDLGFLEQQRQGKIFVSASLQIDYIRSLTLDEKYSVETRVGKIGRSSLELIQNVTSDSGLCTESKMVIVYLDFQNGKKATPISDSLRAALAAYQE
jgi:acyl-CoA thioester hydrolase